MPSINFDFVSFYLTSRLWDFVSFVASFLVQKVGSLCSSSDLYLPRHPSLALKYKASIARGHWCNCFSFSFLCDRLDLKKTKRRPSTLLYALQAYDTAPPVSLSLSFSLSLSLSFLLPVSIFPNRKKNVGLHCMWISTLWPVAEPRPASKSPINTLKPREERERERERESEYFG